MKLKLIKLIAAFVHFARRLVSFARRIVAWFRMRDAEITLHDSRCALSHVTDPRTRAQIERRIQQTQRRLALARADYIALLPPGERRTYDMA